MIKKKDVITMLMPFPNLKSELAKQAHMYVCLEDGDKMRFAKCQTSKPMLLLKRNKPYKFVEEMPDINRNPFKLATLIDCDKALCLDSGVYINESLLTDRRRDVCDELFTDINRKMRHSEFQEEKISSRLLAQVNRKISLQVRI